MKKVILTMIAMTMLLHADYVLEYKMDKWQHKFMYRDSTSSKLIHQSATEKSEIYKIGKKTYIVSSEAGKKVIIDLDELRMLSQYSGLNDMQYIEEIKKPKYKIEKTSKVVNVGGIDGELWIISGKLKGKEFVKKVVVTNDKRVVESIRAMYSLIGSMSGIKTDNDLFEFEKDYVTIKTDDIHLKSFSDIKVPISEYQLPKNVEKQKIFSSTGGKKHTDEYVGRYSVNFVLLHTKNR